MPPVSLDSDAMRGPCAWNDHRHMLPDGCSFPQLPLTRLCVTCAAPTHHLCQNKWEMLCGHEDCSTPYCPKCHPADDEDADEDMRELADADEDMPGLTAGCDSDDDDAPTQPATQRYSALPPTTKAPRPNSLRTQRPRTPAKRWYLSSSDEEEDEVQIVEGVQAGTTAHGPGPETVPPASPVEGQQGGERDDVDDPPEARKWYIGVPKLPDLSACSSMSAVRTTVQEWGKLCGCHIIQIKADKNGGSEYVRATFGCNKGCKKRASNSDYTLEPNQRRAACSEYALPGEDPCSMRYANECRNTSFFCSNFFCTHFLRILILLILLQAKCSQAEGGQLQDHQHSAGAQSSSNV